MTWESDAEPDYDANSEVWEKAAADFDLDMGQEYFEEQVQQAFEGGCDRSAAGGVAGAGPPRRADAAEALSREDCAARLVGTDRPTRRGHVGSVAALS